MNNESLTIDVVSDVVCQWCYIGKRRLESALAALAPQAPDLVAQVRWHPFQLNPGLPPEGIDRARYLEDKFGGAARADTIYARVREAASRSGVEAAWSR
jgi:predicted DsbA family dithiol-disulfide isomerase